MNRLLKWFSGLPPARKRRLVLLSIVSLLAGLFMLGYRKDDTRLRRREVPLVRELTLDGESLERAKYLDLQRQLEALTKDNVKRAETAATNPGNQRA